MKNGLIVMTGLPISKGHQYLIDFSLNFMQNQDNGVLYILIYSRSFEPLTGEIRYSALKNHYSDPISKQKLILVHIADDNVAQNECEDPGDFWLNWKNRIEEKTQSEKIDFLFASENYGIRLAETIGSEFIVCNKNRDVINISGTRIRQNPIENFSQLIVELQPHFKKTITLFGAESCGKTTMSKLLSERLNGYFLPEWAREYLETIGPEITSSKMKTIVYGQFASQVSVKQMQDKPFVFQDTDLLSTIGYYKLWSGTYPNFVFDFFQQSKSDLYIVMNDQIPFEPDILRYGRDKRESKSQFWIDLLKEFNCNYYVVKNINLELQFCEIEDICKTIFNENANMDKFVRT